jgi:hypothetical protein
VDRLLSNGATGASQLWTWNVAGEIVEANSLLFGGGLGVPSALKDAGGGPTGGFIAVAAGLGIVGLISFLALWIRVLAISIAGALAGRPVAAAIHVILLVSFMLHHRLGWGTEPYTRLAFLVCAGIAFGVAESQAITRIRPSPHPRGTF